MAEVSARTALCGVRSSGIERVVELFESGNEPRAGKAEGVGLTWEGQLRDIWLQQGVER
ncbi:hypothetical protein J6590_020302 [Homalodisca vitripennis]|nr:hypothetical protein J6590_020302 [Homalodisca vitripennis]